MCDFYMWCQCPFVRYKNTNIFMLFNCHSISTQCSFSKWLLDVVMPVLMDVIGVIVIIIWVWCTSSATDYLIMINISDIHDKDSSVRNDICSYTQKPHLSSGPFNMFQKSWYISTLVMLKVFSEYLCDVIIEFTIMHNYWFTPGKDFVLGLNEVNFVFNS